MTSIPAASQCGHFFGIVGHQADGWTPSSLERFGRKFVGAAVGGEAQLDIGLDGVQTLVLQLVGLELGHEADAAALLLLIEQDAGAFGGDRCAEPVRVAGGSRSAASRRHRR